MSKFVDLGKRRQVLIAGNAIALQMIRTFLSANPRMLTTVLTAAAREAGQLSDQELADLMQQLDDYSEAKNPKLFNQFFVRKK